MDGNKYEAGGVELLAPAGNVEGFYGAIHAGADAVYLGGNRFGARAYADNFTTEELISCIRYAHIWGRKVFLTVNTLVKESELGEVYSYMKPLYEAGLDGVIVQDIGVLSVLRESFPDLELHASTQMTVTGKYGAELLKKMGVCRIVPARELSLEEIVYLKRETGLAMETFIHGAMCYCYSGQCLFSSVLGGRSGNRGRCAQPCRLPYQVKCDGKTSRECYPLSLKDMCTIEHIPELVEAGIDSFKIEGRMKKPEYAAGVTAIYRKYIDRYTACKGKPYAVEHKDMERLSRLYIRSELQDGYYHRQNGADMVTLHNPAYSGSDEVLLQQIRAQYIEQKPTMSIIMEGVFEVGKEAVLTLRYGESSVSVRGEIVAQAQKQPVTEENIKKQLGKLGETSFVAGTMKIQVDSDAFYPLKAINELRRMGVQLLENALIEQNGLPVVRSSREPAGEPVNVPCRTAKVREGLVVSLTTAEQLQAYIKWCAAHPKAQCKALYLEAGLFTDLWEDGASKLLHNIDCEILVSLPYIVRKYDYRWLEEILCYAEQLPGKVSGFLVRSLEGLGFLLHKKYSGKIYADAGFYMWNRRTIGEWRSVLEGFCIPYELRAGEWRCLLSEGLPAKKLVYGRLPMMLTANCVAKSALQCRKHSESDKRNEAHLIDRYHKDFPVWLNCRQCMNVIYNSVPLSLHGEWDKWKKKVEALISFTVEDGSEVHDILDYFEMLYTRSGGEKRKPPYAEYTTGHEKRGVE
ncbi:MAG: U32 family peptidase [Lachnospiraceae bacterium]|nr:U32 family peptidase [Lachnospiraceae bacterium]